MSKSGALGDQLPHRIHPVPCAAIDGAAPTRAKASDKEIAARLNLSEQTVKNHVHRMLRKIGVPDRLAIVEHYEWENIYDKTA